MSSLYVIEYKAFQQYSVHETNILGADPITKKSDNGVVITMMRLDRENTSSVLNIIIENPNNINDIITGNLQIPFPSEENIKSQIIRINNVIEIVLSIQNAKAAIAKNIEKNSSSDDFITVGKKTFADRVKGDSAKGVKTIVKSIESRPAQKLNTYQYPTSVSNNINPSIEENLKNIIDSNREKINSEKCFRQNEKSNCLIVASHKTSDSFEICKQCKNSIANGARELEVSDYKCVTCASIVFINDCGLPNYKHCNSCIEKEKRRR